MPQTNKAGSWQWMICFYKDFVTLPHWERLTPLLGLVEAISVTEDARRFRAGQSLDALLISTAAQHGLADDDLYIAVQAEQSSGLFVIEYWRGMRRHDLLERFTCEASDLYESITPLMKRLWDDTLGKGKF